MKTLIALFCLFQLSAQSQSLTVPDLVKLAKRDVSFADYMLTNKGLQSRGDRNVKGEVLRNYSSNTEGVYFGTTLQKTDGTYHYTVTYMTSDVRYVVELIKQIANFDVILDKKYTTSDATVYDYKNSDYMFSLSIANKYTDYNVLMIIDLRNAY